MLHFVNYMQGTLQASISEHIICGYGWGLNVNCHKHKCANIIQSYTKFVSCEYWTICVLQSGVLVSTHPWEWSV